MVAGTVAFLVSQLECRLSADCKSEHELQAMTRASPHWNVHSMITILYGIGIVGFALSTPRSRPSINMLSTKSGKTPESLFTRNEDMPESLPPVIEEVPESLPTGMEQLPEVPETKKAKTGRKKDKKKQSKKDADRQWFKKAEQRAKEKKELQLKAKEAETRALQETQRKDSAVQRAVESELTAVELGYDQIEGPWIEQKKKSKRRVAKTEKPESAVEGVVAPSAGVIEAQGGVVAKESLGEKKTHTDKVGEEPKDTVSKTQAMAHLSDEDVTDLITSQAARQLL